MIARYSDRFFGRLALFLSAVSLYRRSVLINFIRSLFHHRVLLLTSLLTYALLLSTIYIPTLIPRAHINSTRPLLGIHHSPVTFTLD
jgi:hypothetical protein